MNNNTKYQILKPLFKLWEEEEQNSINLINEFSLLDRKNRKLSNLIPNNLKPYLNYIISYKKHYIKLKTYEPEKIEKNKAKVRQIYKENPDIREHKRNKYLLKKIEPLTNDKISNLMDIITNVNTADLNLKEQLIKTIKETKNILKKE